MTPGSNLPPLAAPEAASVPAHTIACVIIDGEQQAVARMHRSWGDIIIDAADLHLLNGWILTHAYAAGVRRPRVERFISYTPRRRTSRSLAALILDPPDGYVVDHINGDILDNRRANLRLATPRQNSHNTRAHQGSISRFKGVSYDRRKKRWMAYIAIGDTRRKLGRFKTENEAARAFDIAARESHGAFARLNFPLPGEQAAHSPSEGC